MRVLMIAERFNSERLLREYDLLRWTLLSLRLKAHGMERLQSLGAYWTDSMNLLPPSPVCGEWNKLQAREMAIGVQELLREEYDRFIYVGCRVGQAFRGHPVKVLQHDDKWIVLPHPSGRNMWWNQQSNVEEAKRCLREHGWTLPSASE